MVSMVEIANRALEVAKLALEVAKDAREKERRAELEFDAPPTIREGRRTLPYTFEKR